MKKLQHFATVSEAPTALEQAHRALSLEAAREGIVLLENDGVLPLRPAVGSGEGHRRGQRPPYARHGLGSEENPKSPAVRSAQRGPAAPLRRKGIGRAAKDPAL